LAKENLTWSVIYYAFYQIVKNLYAALKLTGVLWLIYSTHSVYLFFYGKPDFNNFWMVIMVIIPLWIAIAWNRFILKNENSKGFIPRFYVKNSWNYFWTFVCIAIVAFLPILCVIMILEGLNLSDFVVYMLVDFDLFSYRSDMEARTGYSLGNAVGPFKQLDYFTLLVVFVIFYFYFYYRLCTCLPAIAIGLSSGLKSSWNATKGHHSTLMGISVIIVTINGLHSLIVLYLFEDSILLLIWSIFSSWMILMLNISILTTIYEYIVKK
jgi:hypothetical protein